MFSSRILGFETCTVATSVTGTLGILKTKPVTFPGLSLCAFCIRDEGLINCNTCNSISLDVERIELITRAHTRSSREGARRRLAHLTSRKGLLACRVPWPLISCTVSPILCEKQCLLRYHLCLLTCLFL